MPHQSPGDPELAAILTEITGPDGDFRHRQHIHLAFVAVRRYGMPEAVTRICDWIQHIAAYARAPQKYHYTVSRAWVEIVAHHAGAGPEGEDFGAFVARHPVLLDKRHAHPPQSRVAKDRGPGDAAADDQKIEPPGGELPEKGWP